MPRSLPTSVQPSLQPGKNGGFESRLRPPGALIIKAYIRSIIHAALRLVVKKNQSDCLLKPNRILLLGTGHVGDAVIATSLLPVLKSAYPGVEIGFVVASWAQMVLRNHPDVKYLHIVDHKIMNRQLQGREKTRRYQQTRQRALREIRELSYDASISLHPWRPDLLRLAWQAKIPVRAAFRSSILSPLATHLADYPEHNPLIPHGEAQARLLRCLGITEEHLNLRQSSLPPSPVQAIGEVSQLLSLRSLHGASYTVIHMGSGVPVKELPVAFWREMAEILSQTSTIVFTGKGDAESANIATVTRGLPRCIDASNKLSWEGFVAAVRHARVVYSVDTMATHVAAAVSTPCVAILGGNNGVGRWRPEGKHCIVWSNAMPCAPCRRQHGCSDPKCMQGFVPSKIIALSAIQPNVLHAENTSFTAI